MDGKFLGMGWIDFLFVFWNRKDLTTLNLLNEDVVGCLLA